MLARTTRSRVALGVLGALALLRLAYWLLAPPNSDEAYYWLWGLHPALSYYDHPPLHAWTQGLFHASFGRSLLVLRLPAALSTVGTILLLARMARRLAGAAGDGPGTAAVAAAFLASPLLLMMSSFAWNDHVLLFLVVLSASLLLDFLAEVAAGERGRTARLLAGAFALGLAGLAKYNAVFLGVGLLAVVLLDRRLRHLLVDPRLPLAVLAAAVAFSPVILWNAANGFASFRFHLVERHRSGGDFALDPIGPLRFLGPSLLVSPALLWAALAAWRTRSGGEDPFPALYRRAAAFVLLASTGCFLVLSLFSTAIYYWNLVAYPLLVPLAAVAFERRPRLRAAHLATGVALAAVLVAHAAGVPLSVLAPAIRDDDSKEPHGWEEIARAVAAERAARPVAFVAASDYRPGAHLAFASDDPDVRVLSGRRSAFDDWWDERAAAGGAALVVTDAREPMDAGLAARFERVERVAVLPVDRLGYRLKAYELWRGEGFRPRAAPGSEPRRPR